jgi:eukaryotic-like serine/threonine-protein kinase
MLKIDNNSLKGLLINIGIMILILLFFTILFFYWYLPYTTNHGRSVTVPDIIGKSAEEAEDFLDSKDLKYEVTDSVYTTKFPPFTVVKQFPEQGFQVKEGRKISVTLNRRSPEKVKMPQLVGTSVKNAQAIAQSNQLITEIKYVPNKYQNLVIRQLVDGKEIAEGSPVYQGTKVLIEVGDPSQDTPFPVPNYIGQAIEEAEIAIKGQGLNLATPIMDPTSEEPAGIIVRQRPESGTDKTIKSGETIYLWVSQGTADGDGGGDDTK